jgi:hypothetical protein
MVNPHDVEVVVLDWIGVATAVGVAIIGAVAFLWGRWRSSMKQLLDDHAETVAIKVEEKTKQNGKTNEPTIGSSS